jgi:hypothetical protein
MVDYGSNTFAWDQAGVKGGSYRDQQPYGPVVKPNQFQVGTGNYNVPHESGYAGHGYFVEHEKPTGQVAPKGALEGDPMRRGSKPIDFISDGPIESIPMIRSLGRKNPW